MSQPTLHPSTLDYVRDGAVAQGYDSCFAGEELFDYDSRVLAGWFCRPGRLIDLGCGTGRHVVQFAQKGFNVVGVDLSQAMLAGAAAKLQAEGLSARLVQTNFCALPIGNTPGTLPEECCDYALCMFSTLGLIYGRENRLHFLRQIGRLLTAGGQLALHVHNRTYNWWRHEGRMFLLRNWAAVRLGRAEPGDKFMRNYRGIRGMYIHVFTEHEIRELLQQAGFELAEVIRLNRRRNGPLRGKFCPGLRANGYLLRAIRP